MKEYTIYIYRIISKDNLDFILHSGKLCSSSHPECDPNYLPIGETTLIQSRKSKQVIIGNQVFGTLSEYIPFYFGPRPLMLYAIRHGYDVPKIAAHEIVYIISSLEKLKEQSCKYVFTDGHAYDALTQFFDNDAELVNIDWKSVNAKNWKNTPTDPDRKRRKQAECLVYYEMPLSAVALFAVYDRNCLRYVEELLKNHSLTTFDVKLKPEWYYE
ncbi:MAG: DUF4433 domain-containing protein [Ignavibacteriae bacterium]|nr:DUF4433 domain-containing protein [Ignavibacteriota bacterium]